MVVNLDKVSAEFSQKILELIGESVKKDKTVISNNIEKICTSTLGVIQEQGLYAGFLFLLSKSGDKEKQKEQLSIEEFISCGVTFYLINLFNIKELKEIGCSYLKEDLKSPVDINNYKSDLLKHVNVLTTDLSKNFINKSLLSKHWYIHGMVQKR